MKSRAIIILNFIQWKDTIKCVSSIKNSSVKDIPIIIVDNDSPNDSYRQLQKKYNGNENVHIIKSKENLGYSGGNNIGLKYALNKKINNVIISNSDVVFEKNTIKILFEYIENNRNCAVVGPNIKNNDGSYNKVSRINDRNLKEIFAQNFRLNLFGFRKKVLEKYHYLDIPFETSHEVKMVSGACFCISLDFIDKVGFLDENTFLYFEEPILAKKIYENNWYAYHKGDISVFHTHGSSTKKIEAFSFTKYVRSFIYYTTKYLSKNIIQISFIYMLFFLNFFIKSLYRKNFRGKLKFFIKETRTQFNNYNLNKKNEIN